MLKANIRPFAYSFVLLENIEKLENYVTTCRKVMISVMIFF